jgi:acyl dehydratase
MTTALRHSVAAYNISVASENKIHDDAVAKQFGFEGGLVPGVEVYAYMTALPVRYFGIDWLHSGDAECRFQKPVYDGRQAIVSGEIDANGGLSLTLTMDDIICATGKASLPPAAAPPPVTQIATAPLPAEDDRPDASPESLTPGRVLGTYETGISNDEHAAYLLDIREPLELYAAKRITHPGLIMRLANRALRQNVRLGPWIHVGSTIRNHALAHYGDRLAARAIVTAEYEHKGHRFVELDVLVTANDQTSIARIHHTAIYRPRQTLSS